MKTYVLKLPYWATIRDVRNALDKHRNNEEGDQNYILRSAFPPRSYEDLDESLQEAELVPNATLFLKAS